MQDNPILDEETIENAKKLYDGVFYKRYILGLWSVAEGAIYTIFLENKEKYFIENIPHKLNTQINIGLDFGGSESNHALTATATDLNSLYVIKSEVRTARNTTPEDIYAWVAQFVDEIESKYWKINVLYADNAEQTLINGLKSRINVRISDSIKENIVDRIRCTASLMASNRFFMIKNQCKDLITASNRLFGTAKTE